MMYRWNHGVFLCLTGCDGESSIYSGEVRIDGGHLVVELANARTDEHLLFRSAIPLDAGPEGDRVLAIARALGQQEPEKQPGVLYPLVGQQPDEGEQVIPTTRAG